MISLIRITLVLGTVFAAPSVSTLKACIDNTKVKAIWPTDGAAWEAAWPAWNLQFNNTPAVVVKPGSPRDIRLIIKCADGFKIQPRSSGHSAPGPLGGIVMDMRKFKQIIVDEDEGLAYIGSGATNIEILNKISEDGFIFPVSAYPNSGLASAVLGSAVSPLGRVLGDPASKVIGMQIVDAQGVPKSVTAKTDPELFKALLGSGGGHFAVVTSFTVKLDQLPEKLVAVTLECPSEQLDEIRQTPEGKYSFMMSESNDHVTIKMIHLGVWPHVFSLRRCRAPKQKDLQITDFYKFVGTEHRTKHAYSVCESWYLKGLNRDYVRWTDTAKRSSSDLVTTEFILLGDDREELSTNVTVPFADAKWLWRIQAVSETPLEPELIYELHNVAHQVSPHSLNGIAVHCRDPSFPLVRPDTLFGDQLDFLRSVRERVDPQAIFEVENILA